MKTTSITLNDDIRAGLESHIENYKINNVTILELTAKATVTIEVTVFERKQILSATGYTPAAIVAQLIEQYNFILKTVHSAKVQRFALSFFF